MVDRNVFQQPGPIWTCCIDWGYMHAWKASTIASSKGALGLKIVDSASFNAKEMLFRSSSCSS